MMTATKMVQSVNKDKNDVDANNNRIMDEINKIVEDLNAGFVNGLSLYNKEELLKGDDSKSNGDHIKYKIELIELYTEYAPHKLKNVDKMLERYAGQEERMMEAAKAKYIGTNKTKDKDYYSSGGRNNSSRPYNRRGSGRGLDMSDHSLPEQSRRQQRSSSRTAKRRGSGRGLQRGGSFCALDSSEHSSTRERGRRESGEDASPSTSGAIRRCSSGSKLHDDSTSGQAPIRRVSSGARLSKRRGSGRGLQRGGSFVELDNLTASEPSERRGSGSSTRESSRRRGSGESQGSSQQYPPQASSSSTNANTTIRRSSSGARLHRRNGSRTSLDNLDASEHSTASSSRGQQSPASMRRSSSGARLNRRGSRNPNLDNSEHSTASVEPNRKQKRRGSGRGLLLVNDDLRSPLSTPKQLDRSLRRKTSIVCPSTQIESWNLNVGTFHDPSVVEKVSLRF